MHAFPVGSSLVRVRAVDEDGRVGVESRTVIAHAANVAPRGALRLLTPSPSVAVGIEVTGVDPDGHVARIDGDLDGDGTYEVADVFGPGEDAVATHAYRDPGTGVQTIHARVTDDAGATSELSAQVQVHAGNLDPLAKLDWDGTTLSARARDPEGADLSYQFDLDGDGTYELDTGAGVSPGFGPGSHEVGVRVSDGFGGDAVVRRSVFVGSGPVLDIVVPSGVVRPGEPATFTATASAGAAIDWDLDGDGAFDDSSGAVATRTFAQAGAHFVRARVSGRVELRTVTVRADAGLLPVVDELALPPVVPAGRPVSFRASASDPDGGDVTLAFDLDGDGAFDDVPVRAGDAYRWTFDAPVQIAVRATDDGGHTAVRTAAVVPVADALAPDVSLAVGALRAGVPAQLSATAADPDGSPVALAWDLDGDGAFDDGTGAAVAFTPAAPGEVTIAVRAGDVVVTRTVTVGTAPPVAAFEAAGTTLTSTSFDPDGAPLVAQAWDLDGDGAFDDATGPAAQLTTAQPTLVGLKVRDAGDDIGIAYETVEPGGEGSPTPTATVTATPTATATPLATATPGATTSPSPTVTPPPVATATPAARLALATALRVPTRSALLRRGIAVSMSCSEACRATVVASVSPAIARRLGLRRSGEVGRAARRLEARARVTVHVELSRKARVAAAKDRRNLRIELTFTAISSDDRRAVTRQSVTIRR